MHLGPHPHEFMDLAPDPLKGVSMTRGSCLILNKIKLVTVTKELLQVNAQSVVKKTDELDVVCKQCQADTVVVSET